MLQRWTSSILGKDIGQRLESAAEGSRQCLSNKKGSSVRCSKRIAASIRHGHSWRQQINTLESVDLTSPQAEDRDNFLQLLEHTFCRWHLDEYRQRATEWFAKHQGGDAATPTPPTPPDERPRYPLRNNPKSRQAVEAELVRPPTLHFEPYKTKAHGAQCAKEAITAALSRPLDTAKSGNGYIYVFQIPEHPDQVKVGLTSREVADPPLIGFRMWLGSRL
ncbi:hypothetical protein K438DRAFT_2096854 [Mycena galopus ATCC 62051]|nr:hypothetical protein K438DRAFT_2096854 [Mycena galopus ATCC 62051]